MSTPRVFLSSTSVDLEPYRTRVAHLVEGLGQFAVSMDRFPLRPQADAIGVSLDELRTSDLYLLLLAWRYGHVPPGQPGQALSVTHQEYRAARASGKPCFVFLADDRTDADPTLFPLGVRDADHREQVLAFRAEVRQHLVQTFVSVEDLVDKVAAALHQYLLDSGRTPRLPRDLPPRVPGFVGRDDELERLMGTLREGQSVGLSALVAGLGGVGKSALAAEVLRRLSEVPTAFPGGISWVRCDSRTELDGLGWVYDQVLAAWGLRLAPDALRGASTPAAETEVRAQALRARLHLSGPALLLLDNVEVAFPLGRALEHLTPLGITLIVTARHRPGLPGLRLMGLDILEVEAAVHLFAERYADHGGVWEVSRDVPAAQAVVEALGQLPLAIELAAARAALAQLVVSGLAAELQRPGVLVRLQDPLNPAASVHYSFERSLTLLTPSQRLRFAALGLLDGPDWPRPVVEALLEAVPPAARGETAGKEQVGPAIADLDRFAALSLVSLVSSGAARDTSREHGGGGRSMAHARVRVHPLLRRLATEEWARQPLAVRTGALWAEPQVKSGKAQGHSPEPRAGVKLRVGLMAGVQAWAEAFRSDDAQTFAVLEADEALLVGALRRAMAEGVALDAVMDTVSALRGYLNEGGHWRVGIEVFTLALQAARALRDRGKEGAILGTLGQMYRLLGDIEQAQRLLKQALAISRKVANRQGEYAALQALGILARQGGAYNQARHYFEQARAIALRMGDRVGEGRILNSLGILARELGTYEEAHHLYDQSLAIAREVGDASGEASTLGNLGELALDEGKLLQVYDCLDRALFLVRASGDSAKECLILIELGNLARTECRWGYAQQCLDEAEAINRALGSRENQAQAYLGRARLLRDQDQTSAAHPLFEQALILFEAIGQAYEAHKVRTEVRALDAAQATRTPVANDAPTLRPQWWERKR